MKKVIVYTSNTCPYCQAAKAYLNERGISYEERNISTNKDARGELVQRGVRGIPAFLIDDEVIVGFEPGKIESLLDYVIIDCPRCSAALRLPKGKGNLLVTCPKCRNDFKIKT